MQFDIFDTADTVAKNAAELIVQQLQEAPDLLLCAASGSSPEGTFQRLAEWCVHEPGLFDEMRLIKLDEWGGLPMDHPATCEQYMRKFLLDPLHIPAERYCGFRSNPENAEDECARVNETIERIGPIGVSVLGLGLNGHLGLNEPASFLQPWCHVAKLSDTALAHGMLASSGARPKYGMTLGLADILASQTIVLIILGAAKREPLRRLYDERISTEFPASLLWTHPNTHVFCDRAAWPENL